MTKSEGLESGVAIDSKIQQKDGSMAARLERLLDLFAPMTEQPDGTIMRDPEHGLITREDFIRLLDAPTQRHGEEP